MLSRQLSFSPDCLNKYHDVSGREGHGRIAVVALDENIKMTEFNRSRWVRWADGRSTEWSCLEFYKIQYQLRTQAITPMSKANQLASNFCD